MIDELQATIIFNQLKGFSTKKFLQIQQHYGSAAIAYQKTKADADLERLAAKEIETAQKHAIKIIPITSSDYPLALKALHDAPLILYVKGQLPQESTPKIAIIGTRAATNWGKESTFHFAKRLASSGVVVISGLARGIDTAAHSGAIDATVAIIGSGLLHLYPQENEKLADQITKKGALVSEMLLHAPPTRYSFPQRNRLIASLADALLLTEAPQKSGAMITMQLGEKLKKPLFCLPGRAMNETYAGNHLLIKEGKARLVESPEELASLLNIASKMSGCKSHCSLEKKETLVGDEANLMALLKQADLSIDELYCQTRLPLPQLQATLSKLLIKNLIVELPGKRYKLNNIL